MAKMDETKYVAGEEDVTFVEYEQEICTHIKLDGEALHKIITDDFERGRLVARLGCEYHEDTIAKFIIALLIYERHVGKTAYLDLLNKINGHIDSDKKHIHEISTGNGFKLKD